MPDTENDSTNNSMNRRVLLLMALELTITRLQRHDDRMCKAVGRTGKLHLIEKYQCVFAGGRWRSGKVYAA